MRMRDLSSRSGLAPSTIHHYFRSGLMPQPERTGRNAALYSQDHLDRLGAIRWIQSRFSGRLSLARIRRVLELVDQGVPIEVATALQDAVLGDSERPADPRHRLSFEELSAQSGVAPDLLRRFVEAGLVRSAPARAEEPPFDEADAAVARLLGGAVASTGLSPESAAPIAEAIRAQSRMEMDLRNRVVAGLSPADSARTTLLLQDLINRLRPYLFARAREHDIAELERR
ncbi:MAG TPA: hypothetical protein DEB06_06010 [Phycisphaerales bacterium]|nr:hypothetical protein [Phycisphaerales bacterium]